MGRLTFEGLFCDIAKCQETPGGSFCENGMCSQRKVWERLKYYEDMEEQGRLEIHPIAVGDIVYKFVYTNGKYCSLASEWMLTDWHECISIEERRFVKSDYAKLGKTVFLTREKAEQALKGGAE